MTREEAQKTKEALAALFKGHPPRDAFEVIREAQKILGHEETRPKRKIGRDRKERGGFDREE